MPPKKRTPAEAIARRCAMLGVPASQLSELIGRPFDGPLDARATERLQAVWRLAEVYGRVAADERRCFAELDDAVASAVELGCLFEPPEAARQRIEARAGWSRGAKRPPPL